MVYGHRDRWQVLPSTFNLSEIYMQRDCMKLRKLWLDLEFSTDGISYRLVDSRPTVKTKSKINCFFLDSRIRYLAKFPGNSEVPVESPPPGEHA